MENKNSNLEQNPPFCKTDVSGCRLVPILFSTPMVEAILDGRKTQTRRIVKKQPNPKLSVYPVLKNDWDGKKDYPLTLFFYDEKTQKKSIDVEYQKIHYQKDDILWVRETWSPNNDDSFDYKTDYPFTHPQGGWKPSIFMPKTACRIFLKVKNVRVERLQDISERDAICEGVLKVEETQKYNWEYYKNYKKGIDFMSPIDSFQSLWESINGHESWDVNPFVLVIEFERCEFQNGCR